MKGAEKHLLTAACARLRSEAGYLDRDCNVECDEHFIPASAGQTYIAVMPGGWQPGPRHNKSGGVEDMVYGVDVAVVKRITNVPRDRRRNTLATNLDCLDDDLEKVFNTLDFSYFLLAAANVLILTESHSKEGFCEPLRFSGVDKRPVLLGAEFFGGAAGDNAAGLARVMSFSGARRITTKIF